MELTKYTDYSLRILIYLALHTDHMVTIDEISEAYDISRHHVAKAVFHLAQMGVILTTRGRSGGMRLALPPEEINIGALVRKTEPNMNLLECFDRSINTCPLIDACRLKSLIKQAKRAFLEVLDGHTLADMLGNRAPRMAHLLSTGQPDSKPRPATVGEEVP
jgi:Rrf2 family nitric oxide-sensitive transcriptional repressor